MWRLVRPNLTGWLLMVQVGIVVLLPRTLAALPGSDVAEVHVELGFPTWFSWDSPGTWHLHATAFPMLIGLYVFPTIIGGLLSRWRHWRLGPRRLWLFAMVPVIALVAGVAFSLSYWGYAWSLPALDERVHEVKWTGVSAFTSNEDGTTWTAQPREDLKRLHSEAAEDLECCEDGRILNVVGDGLPVLADITQSELAALEAGILANVALEQGKAQYRFARKLRGVVFVGEGVHHEPVAFASFTSGEVSNDHHAMYELLLKRGSPAQPAQLLSSSRTYGDVAGIEGLTAGQVAVALSVIGFVLAVALLTGWTLVLALVGVAASPRASGVIARTKSPLR